MIERLQQIASFLARIRILIVLLGLGFVVLFALSLFQAGGVHNDALMMPATAGFCWSALLYSISRLFVQVPARPGRDHSFLQRLSLRFRRGLMWILGAAMVILTLVVVVLSYQLLRTFFS